LAIGFAIFGIVRWYNNQLEDAFDRGEVSAYSKVEKRVIAVTGELNAAAIKLRSAANAKAAVVDAVVERVIVRGPGKASCPSVAIGSPGGHEQAATETGDAVGGMHDREGSGLIAVPFPEFIKTIGNHDKCLIEAQAWRDDKVARDALIAQERK
jgi:hypothetical protein